MDLTVFGYSVTGFVRRLYFGATGREVIVRGECRMCGSCCGALSIHTGSRWLRSEDEFRRLVERSPEYGAFEMTGRNESGVLKFRCAKLGGDGLCADRDGAPAFCRAYPTPELFFMGGRLEPHCGYRFEVVPSFRKMLRASGGRAVKGERRG
ncbi:MAG: YkgJ family cysteine cluster protein [bacterium]